MESTQQFRSYRLLRIAALVFSLVAIAFISTQPQVSNDFWLQARIGEFILVHHEIPRTLLFPFTEVQSNIFNSHEWLPGVLFFIWIQTFGENGLPIILGFAGLLLFMLTSWLAAQRVGGNWALGMSCAWLALLMENYRHFLRPELIAIFFFLLFWYFLEQLRSRLCLYDILIAFLIMVLWVNSHGSFVLAPVMSTLYALGICIDVLRKFNVSHIYNYSLFRRYIYISATSLACTLVNPVGIDLPMFVLNFGGSSSHRKYIVEWFPTLDPRLIHTPAIWLGLAIGTITSLLCLRYRKFLSAVDFLILIFFLLLGLSAFRFLVYFGFVAALLLAKAFDGKHINLISQRTLLIVSMGFSCIVLFSASLWGNMNGNFPYQSNFPEVFTEPMKRTLALPELQGNVYNSYDLGAELVYRAYPRLRPSIDSRIDSYGEAYFLYHEQLLTSGKLMHEFIRKYDVHFMLLTMDDFNSFQLQSEWQKGRWLVRTMDSRAVLLQRYGEYNTKSYDNIDF